MRKYEFCVVVIIIFLMAISCDTTLEPKEYIAVHIVNHTQETILVYAGSNVLFFIIPSTVIFMGGGQSVLVEKGKIIDIYGETTNTKYGSRSFYIETQWDIY
jgi:predicted permease